MGEFKKYVRKEFQYMDVFIYIKDMFMVLLIFRNVWDMFS